MTDEELFKLLATETKFNKARRIFSGTSGLIQQKLAQNDLSPVTMRKMEFEAVEKILTLYDVDPRKE